ncbi:hypothetical protein LINPERPRIM_LOCUS20837 [Linum perenne]
MSRKKNTGYFHWNDKLDQLLIKSLRTLVDEKMIDPEGKFIDGAYLVLKQMLEHDSPGCGVKDDPNIISRVNTLKAIFLAMQELRGLSGAGWDDEQKMVVTEDSTYDEYVASHPHCAKMNRVPFPFYDGLAYVFGKVHATRKGAVGPKELEKGFPPIEVPNTPLLVWNTRDIPNVETDQTGQPNYTPEEQRCQVLLSTLVLLKQLIVVRELGAQTLKLLLMLRR